MKSRWELILMNLITERLNNRSMNLQLRPSPTICHAHMSLGVTQSETEHSTASSEEAGWLI